jgi:plasmid stability protein
MANLSIKNVPEELLVRLRSRAREHHRSLQGELMVILEEALTPRKRSMAELVQRVQERGMHTGDEATMMVREDRDAR